MKELERRPSWGAWSSRLVLATLVCSIGACSEDPEVAAFRSKAAKLDARCQYVRIALRTDWRDLQVAATRNDALRRISDSRAGHSIEEIEMCAEKLFEVDQFVECLQRLDYACLTGLIHDAELAIPDRHPLK